LRGPRRGGKGEWKRNKGEERGRNEMMAWREELENGEGRETSPHPH